MIKKCEYDGVEFEAKRKTAVYCSEKCRVASNRGVKITHKLEDGGDTIATQVNGKTVIKVGMLPDEPNIDWREYEDPKSPHYIENPFKRPGDPKYDKEANLKAFRKMGLDSVKFITSGIAGFDAITKIPRGRITQIQGPYAVGKTTLCLNMIRGLKDSKVLYIDAEASLNPDLLTALDLNAKNFDLYNESAFIEDIYDVVIAAAQDGKYDMIILDSLAGCTFRTEAEGDSTAHNIGQKAKIVNKLMRIVPMELKNSDTALVIINQEREVIGSYAPIKYTPGGMGPVYAASLIIALKTIKSWRFPKDPKDKIYHGHEVQATVIKSKVGQNWAEGKFKLYYPDPKPVEEPDPSIKPAF